MKHKKIIEFIKSWLPAQYIESIVPTGEGITPKLCLTVNERDVFEALKVALSFHAKSQNNIIPHHHSPYPLYLDQLEVLAVKLAKPADVQRIQDTFRSLFLANSKSRLFKFFRDTHSRLPREVTHWIDIINVSQHISDAQTYSQVDHLNKVMRYLEQENKSRHIDSEKVLEGLSRYYRGPALTASENITQLQHYARRLEKPTQCVCRLFIPTISVEVKALRELADGLARPLLGKDVSYYLHRFEQQTAGLSQVELVKLESVITPIANPQICVTSPNLQAMRF